MGFFWTDLVALNQFLKQSILKSLFWPPKTLEIDCKTLVALKMLKYTLTPAKMVENLTMRYLSSVVFNHSKKFKKIDLHEPELELYI